VNKTPMPQYDSAKSPMPEFIYPSNPKIYVNPKIF
jgi:hypothetical protein